MACEARLPSVTLASQVRQSSDLTMSSKKGKLKKELRHGNSVLLEVLKGFHFTIVSKHSKVRTTSYSIFNSTTVKYCSEAFI